MKTKLLRELLKTVFTIAKEKVNLTNYNPKGYELLNI